MGSDWVPTAQVSLSPLLDPELERDGIEIIYMDPKSHEHPTMVKEEPGIAAAPVNRRHPEGKAKKFPDPNPSLLAYRTKPFQQWRL